MDAVSTMGKPTAYGNIRNYGWRREFATKGYNDGTKFDPSTKLDAKKTTSPALA